MLIDIIGRYIPLQIILIFYGLSRWDMTLCQKKRKMGYDTDLLLCLQESGSKFKKSKKKTSAKKANAKKGN
jgi:hypothetical protein